MKNSQHVSPQPPADVLYRFQVDDPETGETYFVLMGEDGLAFREQAQPMLKAG